MLRLGERPPPLGLPSRSVLLAAAGLLAAGLARAAPLVLETGSFRWTLSPEGRNLGFEDRTSGRDFLGARDSPCAELHTRGRRHLPSRAALAGDRLHLEFASGGAQAELAIERHPRYLELRVASVRGDAEALVFLNVPLALQGRPEEPFAACVLALNLRTRVDQLPALQSRLQATAHGRLGLTGAAAAVAGAPQAEILDVLKEVIQEAPELPETTASGPWAREVPFNRGSYLFNFGDLTEDNVDDWIAMVESLGFNQIDSHGGGSRFFRFGDLHLNEAKWPQGWESYRRIVARLHEAGIGAILHTYAFFIDKGSRYVTPRPHPDLDAFRSFTLAAAVTAAGDEIRVEEPTGDISTVTGFFVRNSVTLRIGDELVIFGAASKEPPWRFTGCQRGAHGTGAAAHPRGAEAQHLKECFGLLVPDPESELFAEIARNHARVIDHCGFDGLYLDAIDGSDILGGPEWSWHHASRFLHLLWRDLDRPVGMEMSAMWHHFWQFRTRWQAWDYPTRGHKRFLDLHAAAVNGGLLLPLHLGWWNFQSFDPPQVEATYPDVIDYLGCKLVGFDAGVSLTGSVSPERLEAVPLFQRLASRLRRYEELRRSGAVSEAVRARLREPGKEFTLLEGEEGRARFLPVHHEAHKVDALEPWSHSWKVENPFRAQPLEVRMEALIGSCAYEGGGMVVLTDKDAGALEPLRTAPGVTASLEPAAAEIDGRRAAFRFTARSEGQVPRHGAWAEARHRFGTLRLGNHQALGVWVHGDGKGELLNFRLESPPHIAHGAIADHYLPVDFEGWRCVRLVETESSRYSDYLWPDGWALYHVYREKIDFEQVESLSVWFQNLPPGEAVTCHLSALKALPVLPLRIRNPRLTAGGRTVVFPVAMESGNYLEFHPPGACRLYGSRGEVLSEVVPGGEIPLLGTGENEITFDCEARGAVAPRVRVTVSTRGDPL